MEGRAPRAVILAVIAPLVSLASWEAAAQQQPDRSLCRDVVGPSGQIVRTCRPRPETVPSPSRPPAPASGRYYRRNYGTGYYGGRGGGGGGGGSAVAPSSSGQATAGSAGGSRATIVRSGARSGSGLVAVRALAEPADFPPKGVGAYGVVAFTAMPLPGQVRRHRAVCEAFKATLIPQERVARDTPLSSQMVTFWPVDDKSTPEARQLDCTHLVSHYDLKTGLDAVQDADRDGGRLAARQGPFLIGWSPAESRFQKDTVVLVFDLSNLDSEQSFVEVFQDWRQKIVDDPSLWRQGFNVEAVRRQLRDTLDRYGEGILKLIKL